MKKLYYSKTHDLEIPNIYFALRNIQISQRYQQLNKFCEVFKGVHIFGNLNISQNKLYNQNLQFTRFKTDVQFFHILNVSYFPTFQNSLNLAKNAKLAHTINGEMKIFSRYLKRILFAIKFSSQQYIICCGKFCHLKIMGDGGPRATSACYSVKLCI